MSIKINSLVEIPFLETKGKIVEIDDNGGYLVEHNAEIDGRRKTIQQWYASEIVKEIKVDKVKIIGIDIAKGKDQSVEIPIKIELGILPEKEEESEE